MEITLIEALILKQHALKMTNEQFAAKLGISRSNWEFALRGQFNPTAKSLSGIIRNFPELNPFVIKFLEEYPREKVAS